VIGLELWHGNTVLVQTGIMRKNSGSLAIVITTLDDYDKLN